jgi:YtxH-like protein
MTAFRRRPSGTNWIRFALKLGLLATDATVLSAVGRMLAERDVPDEGVPSRQRRYVDLPDRRGWSHSSALLAGAAIGFGVGILFAPVSGEEARSAIRERARDVRDRVSDVAAWATRSGSSGGSRRPTGTYAE